MSELRIGYARVSTDEPDLAAQRADLLAVGVEADRVYGDHGLTGTNRNRPGLRQALAACRAGDPWSSPNSTGWPALCPTAAPSPTSCTAGSTKLDLDRAVYEPTDLMGRLLFNTLAGRR